MHGSRFFVYLFIFSTVTLFSLFPLHAGCARAQCTPGDDCTACPTKGEKMKCKFDTLLGEGEQTITILQDPVFADVLPPAQKANLEKSKENLGRGRNRLQAADVHLMAKKKETSCQLVEIDGDGLGDDDGVCDPKTEHCAEVPGDGIGDDDGICWPLKGKKREVCVEICDREAVLQDEANVDDELAAQFEGIYDTAIGQTRELNEQLPQAAALLLTYKPRSDTAAPCPLNAEGLSRTNSLLRGLARSAATTGRADEFPKTPATADFNSSGRMRRRYSR